MDDLRKKVKELLENESVKIVIGYGNSSDNTAKAEFIRKAEDVDKLLFNEHCIQNLAVYLVKGEVKNLGKPCIIAILPALRSILQLASENQLKEEDVIVIAIKPDGSFVEMNSFKKIEEYVASSDLSMDKEDKELLEKIKALSPEERWQFWSEQFNKCIKCYACRAACPMCYCKHCQVEYNQPQLITVEATQLGSMEWHIMRAMHLAGRCVNCGECKRACTMEIPINILSYKIEEVIKEKFNVNAGTKADLDPVMSNFKPEDKENFIR